MKFFTIRKLSLGLIIFLTANASVVAQNLTQRGSNIIGQLDFEAFGHSVSISNDGTVVAIGGPLNDGAGNGFGYVRVLEFENDNWVQKGSRIFGNAGFDRFGEAIDLSASGDTLIIGQPGAMSDRGAVRIYRFDSSNWVQVGLTLIGSSSGDRLGESVAISSDGNVIVAGASESTVSGDDEAGRVKVYEWSGASWLQRGSDFLGTEDRAFTGSAVDISADGSIVAFGAAEHNGPGTSSFELDQGKIEVHAWNGASWTQLGTTVYGQFNRYKYGTDLALSADGNTFITGTGPGFSNFSPDANLVAIYELDNNRWVQKGDNIVGDNEDDRFGNVVDISNDGDKIVVGAPVNAQNGEEAGQAKVFQWSQDTWTQIGDDILGFDRLDDLGTDVAISGDGLSTIVSSPGALVNGDFLGFCQIFAIPSVITSALDFEEAEEELTVYPQPIMKKFNITYEDDKIVKTSLFDLRGNKVQEFKDTFENYEINSNFDEGIYFLEVQLESGDILRQSVLINK